MKRMFFLLAVLALTPVLALAHCDTLNGPVAQAGRHALATGDLTLALKWVHAEQEPELRAAFARALKVNKSQDADSRALSEQFFLETLVRLHRAGEGAPFTGLRPAEAIEPSIAHADAALESGDVDELAKQISDSIATELRARFAAARAARGRQDSSVEAGRGFVAAYVRYVHFVEAAAGLTGKEAEHRHE